MRNPIEYLDEAVTLAASPQSPSSSLVRVGWRKKGGKWEKVVWDQRNNLNGVVIKIVEAGPDAGKLKTYYVFDEPGTTPLRQFLSEISTEIKPVGAID